MRPNKTGFSIFLSLLLATGSWSSNFPNSAVPLPAGWTGPVFKLSQDYPGAVPQDAFPWMQFDPSRQPQQYMMAVLSYCLQGNVANDWTLQDNPIRKWYHAPWMHWGNHGREPIHGLTYERMSLPGELSPQQTGTFQNWAVGFYNAPGGYTFGRVWANPTQPNVSVAQFPPNTVSMKLLFTEATPDQVPYLVGSKEWQAYVFANPQNQGPSAPRIVTMLRLLQVDVAIRDPRASTTGWVFGTFIYDGRVTGNDPYNKLRPVGVMWGNDPGLGPNEYEHGARPKQTRLNAATRGIIQHYGWLGRLDGPVDNPKSSCLSCHSTAQTGMPAPMIPPTGTPEGSAVWMNWFRNIAPPQAFSSGTVSLDYSLQMAGGLQNLVAWKNACAADPHAPVVPPCTGGTEQLNHTPTPLGYRVTRSPDQQ